MIWKTNIVRMRELDMRPEEKKALTGSPGLFLRYKQTNSNKEEIGG
ncbi:hypothetical protein [Christiangramia aestuarii]|nr:hypothetical protein [Christiangramia aestuarii]